jgi:hypothetical protein
MNRMFFDDFTAENAVVISRPRFVQEHTKLLQILRDKNPKQLENERKDQAKELKKIVGNQRGTRQFEGMK